MIKKIHFIWVNRKGSPPPSNCLGYINPWRRLYPGFQIKLWGVDDMFGFKDPKIDEAWKNPDYDEACISNRMRLLIVQKEGGLYVDIDTQPVKPITEELIGVDNFVVGQVRNLTRPGKISVETNIFYAGANHPILSDLLDHFDCCPGRFINAYLADTYARDIKILPEECFHGHTVTPNTYTLHHSLGSWVSNQHSPVRKRN